MRVNSYDRDAPTPEVGSRWRWGREQQRRPLGADQKVVTPAEEVVVREVKWNGEEWWVRTEGPRFGLKWNDLGLFWEEVRALAPPADTPR